MFGIFEAKKIVKQLENIQKNVNFDYDIAENYHIEKDASDLIKNTYYFAAHSYNKRQSLILKLQVSSSHSEVYAYYLEGNNRFYLEQIEYTNNCPLKIFKDDGVWSIVFAGYFKKNNYKDLVRISFSGKFLSEQPVINYHDHLNNKKVANIIKKEKNHSFLEEYEKREFCEYEQLGILKGKIIVEGQHSLVEMPCVRKHFYGKLDWNKINNHLWVTAYDKEKQYSFHMSSLPSATIIESACVKEKEFIFANDVKYERQLLLKGSLPDNLNILFEYENKTVGLHIKKIDDIKYIYQEGEYEFIQGVGEFLIEGVNYRGIIEVGYNKDKSRWFNGKDINKVIK